MKKLICPVCGEQNIDDWPLKVGEQIIMGGCQDCWEEQTDGEWWEQLMAISQIILSDCIPAEEV